MDYYSIRQNSREETARALESWQVLLKQMIEG